GKYPLAGLLRPVYALFIKDDGRVREYLEQARGVGDEWLSAAAWLMTAGLAENDGNVNEARFHATEAMKRFRALGERWGLSMALRTIGNIATLDGDLDDAIATYTEAGRLLAELGHDEDLAQVQLRLPGEGPRAGGLAEAPGRSAAP